ncbi:hypothetical protein K9M09_01495 [Patescibacteria group bacterium]|nr:hypothetical protein [Patescibacteria group bacterium]
MRESSINYLQGLGATKKKTAHSIVLLSLDQTNVEGTELCSAASVHKLFMAEMGKVIWFAFNMPLREAEFERMLNDADQLIIHSSIPDGPERLNKQDEQQLKRIIERVKTHNRQLKLYNNSLTGRKIFPDSITFKEITELIKTRRQAHYQSTSD